MDKLMQILKSYTKEIVWSVVSFFSRAAQIRTSYKIIAKCCPPNTDIVYERYLNRFAILIDNGRFIEAQVLHAGYEIWLQRIITDYVPLDEPVCIDVGANVGLISIMLVNHMRVKGRIIAFEASPPFFDRLLRNLAFNPGLDQVITPINAAVADAAGTLFWHEDPDQKGNGMVVPNENGCPIEAVTIDEFIALHPIERLDFVKIDVEGFEHEVLRGGMKTWARFHPVILFETLPTTPRLKGYPVWEEITKEFSKIGYKIYAVDENGVAVASDLSSLGHNSLLIPNSMNNPK
jgi:FkbM family methyltransferase